MISKVLGAPIRAGEVSPLRVATGGDASWGSKAVAAAHPPARIQGASKIVNNSSPKGSDGPPGKREKLDSFRTVFYA
jgi:hypothetical protein